MATKSIGLLAALAPAMAIRQLMSDVRPDEEAALRALVQPVEPIQQPQDSAVLGHWPMQALGTHRGSQDPGIRSGALSKLI